MFCRCSAEDKQLAVQARADTPSPPLPLKTEGGSARWKPRVCAWPDTCNAIPAPHPPCCCGCCGCCGCSSCSSCSCSSCSYPAAAPAAPAAPAHAAAPAAPAYAAHAPAAALMRSARPSCEVPVSPPHLDGCTLVFAVQVPSVPTNTPQIEKACTPRLRECTCTHVLNNMCSTIMLVPTREPAPRHPLSIQIETPAQGRGGCSRMTVPPHSCLGRAGRRGAGSREALRGAGGPRQRSRGLARPRGDCGPPRRRAVHVCCMDCGVGD